MPACCAPPHDEGYCGKCIATGCQPQGVLHPKGKLQSKCPTELDRH